MFSDTVTQENYGFLRLTMCSEFNPDVGPGEEKAQLQSHYITRPGIPGITGGSLGRGDLWVG